MAGEQLNIFDGLARDTDPDTSHAAANVARQRLRGLVVQAFIDAGAMGLTDDELVGKLPNEHGPTVKSLRSRITANTGKKPRPVSPARPVEFTGHYRESNTNTRMRVHAFYMRQLPAV